jgi:ribosomal protein L11 methyltransferase
MKMSMNPLESKIVEFIADAPSKVSFGCLKRHFCEAGIRTRELKKQLATLVQAGRLFYTSHFGCSFIEISYAHPHPVSDHVVLKSSRCTYAATADQYVVTIEKGASFGGGEHPSTRLAIQLIDAVLYRMHLRKTNAVLKAVDIGTGSGILSIVGAKLGVDFIDGIDTDPCAVFEARENVRQNGLQDRIRMHQSDLRLLEGNYDIVFANLRSPTLISLRDRLTQKVQMDGMLFFSGLKTEELISIRAHYQKSGFFERLKRSEKGWSAICLTRGALLDE